MNDLTVIIDKWIEKAEKANYTNHVLHFKILREVLDFTAPPDGEEYRKAAEFIKTCKESEVRRILILSLDQIEDSYFSKIKADVISALYIPQGDLF